MPAVMYFSLQTPPRSASRLADLGRVEGGGKGGEEVGVLGHDRGLLAGRER